MAHAMIINIDDADEQAVSNFIHSLATLDIKVFFHHRHRHRFFSSFPFSIIIPINTFGIIITTTTTTTTAAAAAAAAAIIMILALLLLLGFI